MTPRFLFLDIDGVIATDATYALWREAGSPKTFEGFVSLIDPTKIAIVDAIAVRVGASIVISSNWRYQHIVPFSIIEILQAAGLKTPIVGRTPNILYKMSQHPHRGREIYQYMVDAGLSPAQVVILDDDRDAKSVPGHAVSPLKTRVLLTREADGILESHIDQVSQMFEPSGG